MLLYGYGGRLRLWLASGQGGRLPDPDRQQDHRGRKWQHVQDDDGAARGLKFSNSQAVCLLIL
jgi:hypothetical protein